MVTGEMGSMQTVAYAEELWFGSLPDPETLALAKRRGIERVIDLCSEQARDLQEAADAAGLEWLQLPLPEGPLPEGDRAGPRTSLDSELDRAVDRVLVQLASPVRTLMFCRDGSRSAALFAIHRVVDQGVPLEQALAEARRVGLTPGSGEALVRAQVARLQGRSIPPRTP